jgi:hypothetical protein
MVLKNGYGLRDKKSGELLSVSTQHTDADCSVDEIHTLSIFEDVPWIVEDKLTASYVRLMSEPWWSADYETPINPYKAEDLEVVKIEFNIDPVNPDHIPTYDEFLKMRFLTKGKSSYNPDHYKVIMDEHKRRGKIEPPIYHLCELQILLMENEN